MNTRIAVKCDPDSSDSHLPASRWSRAFVMASAFCAVSVLGWAQASQNEGIADEETVITLSPFEVNAAEDQGYEAQNTLSGTRLNTSVKDVGVTMTILTDKFMEDLAANSTNALVNYTPGSEVETTQGGEGASTVYWGDNPRIRGVRIENIVRNQFRTNITADSYNAGRFEFSRGGNSILFGIGNPAGLVNRYTNDASFFNSNRYRFQIDDEGGTRHELNFNRELIDGKLAARVAVLHEEGEHWIRPLFNNQDRLYGALTFKPVEKLTFKLRAEKYDWERSIASYGIHQDAATLFLDAAEAAGQTPAEHAIPRNYWQWIAPGAFPPEFQTWGYTGANSLVIINDELNPTGSVRNWQNKVIGATRQVAGGKNASLPTDFIPRDFNIFGNSNFQDFEGENFQAVAQFRLNDYIDFELAANQEEVDYDFMINWSANLLRIDGSSTLTDGATPNPNAGQFFVTNDTQWRYDQKREIDNLRATASLRYDFAREDRGPAWLGSHNLAVMFERAESSNLWDSLWLANTTPETTPVAAPLNGWPAEPRNGWNGANVIKIINYVDLANQRIYGPTDPRDFQAYANQFDGINAEWVPSYNSINGSASDETIDSVLAVLQSKFLEDRLVTTFGWRKDTIKARNGVVGQDPTKPAGWAVLAENVPLDNIAPTVSPTTGSRGANFYLLRNKGVLDYLVLYANNSTTFGSNSVGLLPDRERQPNTTGDTLDYGVKFGLAENRLNAVFTVFDVALENEAAVNLPWANFGLLHPDFVGIDPSTTRDTRDFVSKGWEFQLTANLTKNWRAMVSFDHFSTEFANVAPTTGRIFDEYTSEFLADPTRIVNPDASDPKTAQEVYDEMYFAYLTEKAQEGARTMNERRNKIVLVSAYDFTEGKLAGFGFGADVIWQDKASTGFALRQLDNGTWVPDADNPFYSDDLLRMGAFVKYNTRLFNDRIGWTVQLNVRNIGGVDPYVVRESAVSTDPTTPVAWYTNRGLPTQYVLSSTFEF